MTKTPTFSEPEIIYIADDQVACDGGSTATGHPRVYLTVDPKTHMVDCGYCDRRYIQDLTKTGGKKSASH